MLGAKGRCLCRPCQHQWACSCPWPCPWAASSGAMTGCFKRHVWCHMSEPCCLRSGWKATSQSMVIHSFHSLHLQLMPATQLHRHHSIKTTSPWPVCAIRHNHLHMQAEEEGDVFFSECTAETFCFCRLIHVAYGTHRSYVLQNVSAGSRLCSQCGHVRPFPHHCCAGMLNLAHSCMPCTEI